MVDAFLYPCGVVVEGTVGEHDGLIGDNDENSAQKKRGKVEEATTRQPNNICATRVKAATL